MTEPITMPQLGMDMAEGTFLTWVKNVGDAINTGDVIAEIETDKTTIEIESPVSGTIVSLVAKPGEVVKVGAIIGYVGQPGEHANGGGQPAAKPAEPAPAASETPKPAPAPETEVEADGNLPGGVKASPLARNIASERGIDLHLVRGTGPGGRITKEDVETFQPPARTAPALAPETAHAGEPVHITAPFYGELPSGPDVEISDTSNLRKRIGKRMVESKQQVPHFYVTTEVDVEPMLQLRQQLNAHLPDDSQKISVNDLIVKATALTLRQFPNLNTHFYGDKIARHKRINIGIAVALPQGGLMNVVAKDADTTALGTMAAHNKAMIARAREGKVKPDDLSGSTFTVSNLGPFDVEHFIAIVNPPEAGILAIGTAKKVPIVREDGTIGVGNHMKITISVDHRVSDGAEGAAFLQALKTLLEQPMRLLI